MNSIFVLFISLFFACLIDLGPTLPFDFEIILLSAMKLLAVFLIKNDLSERFFLS